MEGIKPNLFLIGAPKAGTSAIATALGSHPDIYLPKKKEPRYFDAKTYYDYPEDYPVPTLGRYLQLYECAEDFEYRVDASVFNMYSAGSILDILKFNPEAKFILVIRDPVEASLSMHKQRLKYVKQNMREVSSCFMDCWNSLDDRKRGYGYPDGCRNKILFRYDKLYSYETVVPTLIDTIPRERLLILFYEDLNKDTQLFYTKIFKFLGVGLVSIENEVVNSSRVVSNNPMMNYLFTISRYIYKFLSKVDKGGLLKKTFFKIVYTSPEKIHVDSSVDSTVVDFFQDTRVYIRNLKK